MGLLYLYLHFTIVIKVEELSKHAQKFYRVERKSLTTRCKSQSMRNRWITTIYDLIRPRGKSFGGVTLTAAILDSGRTF
jgi:hypothetical protein